MNNKMRFNEVPKIYDKYRPKYCPDLFSTIVKYSDIDKSKCVIEVGMGTGQATSSILKTGCEVTAIELGRELVKFSRDKFKNCNNLSIKYGNFESSDFKDSVYDLLYSATAFHWIDETIGYSKAYRMLKSGGAIILFWNRPWIEKGNNEFDVALQSVYKKYKFEKAGLKESNDERYERRRNLLSNNGFIEVKFELFYGLRMFNSIDYIGLLNTYSDHRAIDINMKAKFESEIISVINDFGGIINITDTIELYMGKKPTV